MAEVQFQDLKTRQDQVIKKLASAGISSVAVESGDTIGKSLLSLGVA